MFRFQRLVMVGIASGCLLIAPAEAVGQPTRADSAAVLMDAADTFEAQGRWDVTEALLRLLISRFPDTPAADRARAMLAEATFTGVEGGGRTELQVWSTLYGLSLGVLIPTSLGTDDPEAYGVGLLLGGPVGFFSGRSLARGRALTEGQARAITMGGTWGAWQGLAWTKILDIGTDERCLTFGEERTCFEDGSDGEEVAAGMIVGSLVGVGVGAALSTRDISPGLATTINFGSLWGSWFGVATGILADQEDDGLWLTTALGGNAGIVTTALLGPSWNVTRDRARLVSIAGVIGGLAGLGIDLIVQPDDEKAAVAIPLATSIIGLGIGMGTTRPRGGAEDAPVPESSEGPGGIRSTVGALIEHTDGAWRVGPPVPSLTWVERLTPLGATRAAALRVQILHAVF